ncbi:MAG: glycosyltransferase family 2 protein [Patescibacteria group bacterium]
MTVVVVIPAFNESRTIAEVIHGCLQHASEVMVINDGSCDDTALRARQAGAAVFEHMVNRGYGAALQTGIQAALMRGADIIVTIDADGQHEPEEIIKVIEPLQKGEADIVIGDRFGTQSKREGMSLLRKAYITAGNLLTWILYGVWLSDTQSGFRAYTRNALRNLQTHAQGMEFSSEIIGEAARLGLRIATIPITVRYTDYSIGKGQNISTGIGTAFRLFLRRILR